MFLGTEPVRRAAFDAGGAVLAGATRVLAAVRTAGKPLHPEGSVTTATLHRHGLEPPTGVAWLDEEGTDQVVVRVSRALGLPDPLPDTHGLAMRVPLPGGGHGDVLLGTTGWGRLSRFVFTVSREPFGRPMSTLLPYRSAAGPMLLGARATGEQTLELACATVGGDWRVFADLELTETEAPDQDISFDAIRNELPGLPNFGWVERLREPSYDTARDSRP